MRRRALAEMPQPVRIAHHVQRRMSPPSISNADVCTGPSASTMTPGRPLTVAKRTVKWWRHHHRARARDVNEEPRRTIGAFDDVRRRRTLPPPSVTTRTSLASILCQRIEIARLDCRCEGGHELCMFASISPERAGGAVAPRGRAAWTCARARRRAAGTPPRSARVRGHSLNEKSNTSCSMKAAARAATAGRASRAARRTNPRPARCGCRARALPCRLPAPAARDRCVSFAPARADVSMSRQIRVVVVMRNALGSDTLSRSAPCRRRYVSCTRPRRPPSTRACGMRDRAGADGTARSSRRDSGSSWQNCPSV